MKRLIVSLSICCASWLLASCGGGDGTLESCASSYSGTFDGTSEQGDVAGRVVANLVAATGTLQFFFTFDTTETEENYVGSVTVMDDGTLMPGTSGLILDGKLDLDTCEGEGTWDYNFYGSGNWRLAIPDAAF